MTPGTDRQLGVLNEPDPQLGDALSAALIDDVPNFDRVGVVAVPREDDGANLMAVRERQRSRVTCRSDRIEYGLTDPFTVVETITVEGRIDNETRSRFDLDHTNLYPFA